MIYMPELDKPLYTIRESAQLLSTSDATIRRMMKAGELSAVKVHGTWRIRRESLEKYLTP